MPVKRLLKEKSIILFFSVISLLLIILSVSVPIMEYYGISNETSLKVHMFLGNICHQLPTRSLRILGLPLSLCSRCFGIYLGIFIAGIYAIRESKVPKRLAHRGIILMIPLLIEVSTVMLNMRSTNNDIRLITGFLCGLGIGLILYGLSVTLVKIIEKVLTKDSDYLLKITHERW